ncbi:minor tail protein [Mycobacterium phage DirtMonster]|uniref:Minor tail protein n=3 Tax=Bixzunavirus Bxz1 TaxID=2006134 RepID=A0A1B1PBX1_9CAUD|nr:gp129 [Mycobacterium phage Catera]ACU41650.1 hypothetical protein LRRHOOD_126 [Mycobacterium phage LRRHood]ANT41664.1 hypothetical protein PBI_LITTLETON_133 [Mycobacterium phage Littleton]ATN90090.1 hypothetical protein SEA_KOGUMA_130 [Mycobacterium phage Koguma]QAY09031.1 minor tail protein [Mycobacterium phage JustHall]QED11320.1 hypothetical protein SEA_LOLAVINCA_133 [Mycobacterium phage LolaVinca]QFG10877.1 minor tail protein [Mycobacterium phage Kboogie]WNM64718.1 minor tail protein 
MPNSNFHFPQQSIPLAKGERGIATLHHPDVGSLRFRTNPKEFGWSYTLNKRIDQTYGGRVVQLLGVKIDDFTIKADAGGGRWEYMHKVNKFLRDVMVVQRNGVPATFEYTTRGWKLNGYISTIPFQDSREEVAREFAIQMKVQEDVSGVMSKNTLDAALRNLKDGVGFKRSKYNDPVLGSGPTGDSESSTFGGIQEIADIIGQASEILNQFGQNLDFLPGGLPGVGK